MKELNTTVAALVFVFLLAFPIALWQAWCLTLLWQWYALSNWGALPMEAAFGLSLMVSLLQMRAASKNGPGLADKISMALVGPAMILGFGWAGLLVFG